MTRSHLAALVSCFSLGSLMFPGTCLAASVTVGFTATANSGPLASDSYNGSFSYDTTGLTGVGSESTNPTAFSFHFFSSYSLADTSFSPITFDNGTVNGLAFLVDNGNDVSTGTPDFYITLNQGLPDFLYGYDTAGLNYPNPDGSCPDSQNACYSWQGSGNVKFGTAVATPEPAGPLPVLGYLSVVGGLLWIRRSRFAR